MAKKQNKLRARWSKSEQSVLGEYPLGINTNTDLAYMFHKIFSKEVIDELIGRGYDIKTLKFEIAVKPEANPERFPTLYKQYCNAEK